MTVLTPILVAISAIFVIYLFVKNWRYYHLLRKVPSPATRLFIGNSYELLKHRDDLVTVFLSWMQEMRSHSIICGWIFHRPLIVLLKHDSAEAILNNSHEIEKSSIYDLMHPWLGLGLLTSSGSRWHAHRKLLTPSFHFRILENFLPIFNEQSQTMVTLLSKKAGSGRFDIYPYITRCALDIICETAMGKRLDSQMGKNIDYINALNVVGDMIMTRVLKPWLANPWIFELSSYGRRNKKNVKILHDFTNDVIKERRREYEANKGWKKPEAEDNVYGSKNRRAFLDTLIEASYKEELGLTDEVIREQTDTFMFEGHDTTAVNMTYVIYNLGWCPSVQEVAHQEIDRIFGNSNRPVSLEDLSELKYLEAVIKETLRVLPSVSFFGRRLKNDVVIAGYTIPSGAEVLVSPTSVGTDPNIYENPENFNPDRFFSDDFQTRHPYAYVPFSAGPRNCIGQKFAMMEEKVVIANLLRNFEIKVHNDLKSMKPMPDLVLRPIHGVHVTLEKRSAANCG